MSNLQPVEASMQFIPAHWLELAYWNRPMIVYSRTIPDPDPKPATQERVSVSYRPKPTTNSVVRRKSA